MFQSSFTMFLYGTHIQFIQHLLNNDRTGGDPTTNQRQGNHDRWPEANVEQQYQKGPDRLVHHMLTVPAAINPDKSLLWDPNPGPSSPSRTYA